MARIDSQSFHEHFCFRMVLDWQKRISENIKVNEFGSCPRSVVVKVKCWKPKWLEQFLSVQRALLGWC